jgi:carbon storage regulator
MLLLARRAKESVIIGNRTITIRIMKIERGVVTLGIEAPRDVPVHREEVFERIEDEIRRLAAEVEPEKVA